MNEYAGRQLALDVQIPALCVGNLVVSDQGSFEGAADTRQQALRVAHRKVQAGWKGIAEIDSGSEPIRAPEIIGSVAEAGTANGCARAAQGGREKNTVT